MAEFNNRLKELRESRRLTQKQLADIMGLSKQTISQYELGKRSPSLEILEALCDEFNVQADYMLGRTDFIFRLLNQEDISLLLEYERKKSGK